MRRLALILTFSLLPASMALPASADPGHRGPRITRFEFVAAPLKAGALERLVVVAHDPDSWISEIQVLWEDEDMAGGVIFAHTFCVQDPEFEHPGTPARLRLDVTFEHPGPYHVEARAISEKRCQAGRDTRISRTVEQDVTVEDPVETFADPDDGDGPMDVLGVEQTVVADEAALGNHVVHTLTMAADLGPAPLAGSADDVELRFDTDDDPRAERIVRVDAGTDGALHAWVTDRDGALLGEGVVSASGPTLSIDIDARLLGSRVREYRWFVRTHDASSPTCAAAPCTDRAPDTSTYLHVP